MRLIDADALLKSSGYNVRDCSIGVEYIISAPTVDAAAVVHGRWIYHTSDIFPADSTQECSVCHEEESMMMGNDNYCPNCGAKMNLQEDGK